MILRAVGKKSGNWGSVSLPRTLHFPEMAVVASEISDSGRLEGLLKKGFSDGFNKLTIRGDSIVQLPTLVLTHSGSRRYRQPEPPRGWDAALDVAGLAAGPASRVASGLWKTGILSADVGINLYQGYSSSLAAYADFYQGNYLSGGLNALGGFLGFAGAGFGTRNLRSTMRFDPTTNPLNYSLHPTTASGLGFFGDFKNFIRYHGPQASAGRNHLELAPDSRGLHHLQARFENIPESMWADFPAGVPRPTGPINLLEGVTYDAARQAANNINRKLNRGFRLGQANYDVHEIVPVKFGGSPTDLANKVGLPRPYHRQVSAWFTRLQRLLEEGER